MFLFCTFFKVDVFITGTIARTFHIGEGHFFPFFFLFFLLHAGFLRCRCLDGHFFHDSGFFPCGHHAHILDILIVIILCHGTSGAFGIFAFHASCTAGYIAGRVAFLLRCPFDFIDFGAYLLHSCFLHFFHIFPLRTSCAVCCRFCILIGTTHQRMCLHQNILHFFGQVIIQICVILFIRIAHTAALAAIFQFIFLFHMIPPKTVFSCFFAYEFSTLLFYILFILHSSGASVNKRVEFSVICKDFFNMRTFVHTIKKQETAIFISPSCFPRFLLQTRYGTSAVRFCHIFQFHGTAHLFFQNFQMVRSFHGKEFLSAFQHQVVIGIAVHNDVLQ